MNSIKTTALFVVTIIIASVSSTLAQPDTSWTRMYHWRMDDWCDYASALPEGGFVLSGVTESFEGYWWGSTHYILRINEMGEELSLLTVPDPEEEEWEYYYENGRFIDFIPTADGGYAFLGTSNDEFYDHVIHFLAKLDIDGSLVRIEEFDANGSAVRSFIQTSDGGYLVMGFNGNIDRITLIKTSSLGVIQWTGEYGDGELSPYCLAATDTSIIVAGTVDAQDPHSENLFLLTVTLLGEESWLAEFEGDRQEKPTDLRIVGDRIITVGSNRQYIDRSWRNQRAHLWIADMEGNLLVERTFEGAGLARFTCVEVNCDEEIAMAGVTGPSDDGRWLDTDYYFVQIDEEGNEVSSFVLGGDDYDNCEDIAPTRDGGFLLAGSSESFHARRRDIWLVKAAAVQQSAPGYDKVVHPVDAALVTVYPNPFNSTASIRLNVQQLTHVKVNIFDVNGRFVLAYPFDQVLSVGKHEFLLDGSHLTSGTYTITFAFEGYRLNQNVILVR
ncbi:MAG: T9SS type A sorting domain-containing protein [Candidatus Hatepunaea meridiana]|nr:T9SS type A sorting domain-containing protein [Candidatus Hatepunaea meridiana]